MITAADPGGNGGSYKLDWSVACVPAGSNVYTTPVYGTVSSTGTFSFTGTNSKEIGISNLDISTSSCAPNMLTLIRATRDNSVSGNSSDDLAVFSATVTYSVK
jgi:hypothetical protein